MNSTTAFDQPHRLEIRVRYHEVDGQGRVHHAQYLNYFERGRVEMLRDAGISYKELERTGLMLVVKSMNVEFHTAAEFDDQLVLSTGLLHCHGARIDHRYELSRSRASDGTDGRSVETIVTAVSVIACIDREGRVRRLPDQLQLGRQSK